MRFSTQPPWDCGLDLHACSLAVCLVRHDGARVLHRPRPAAPAPVRHALAPARDGLGVAGAGLGTGDGLAARGAAMRLAYGRGPCPREAHTRAARLRGGRLPPAAVAPVARRATRARVRRRTHGRRTRAALLAHVPPPHRQANLPARGPKLADTPRDGVVARVAAPAVPTARGPWPQRPR
jgi:hypothetical protein